MSNINVAAMSGNLTRDAELRQTNGGASVLAFAVAVNERRKNGRTGEWEDYPTYIECTLFGNLGPAIAPDMTKGQRVAVAGRLHQSRWQAQDGTNRSRIEVIATDVVVMRSGDRRQAQTRQAASGVAQAVQAGLPGAQVTEYQANAVPAPQSVVQQANAAFNRQPQPAPAPAPMQAPAQPSVYDDDIPF
jgi:single-strand DNA-binding protein